MSKLIPIAQMPLRPRHWYILAIASFEQITGAVLSTLVGIMIPLILMAGSPHLSAADQGILGASGLAGIALGSMVIGRLMDSTGYLFWFRVCPLVIAAASFCAFCSAQVGTLALFLFITGIGVGGGYSLDSGYISELVPERWESFFVGLAKAACSLGFIGGAAAGWLVLQVYPAPAVWPYLMLFITFFGVVTFIFRIRWYQSPRWLLTKGFKSQAQKAAKDFLGPDAEILPLPSDGSAKNISWALMFQGKSLQKVILSGISWACEGLGVYGFGVFLPILVMALGIQGGDAQGIPKILDSVRTTVFINLFIAAGFALGLACLHRINIFRLMGFSFILCAIALATLLAAYELKWPVWISFLSFVLFEIALNAGPHLVTYIVPSKIYTVDELGAGTGIATMLGKIGALLGVFFMPALLSWGGVSLVLCVSIIVQLLGAAVTFIYGKKLKLL